MALSQYLVKHPVKIWIFVQLFHNVTSEKYSMYLEEKKLVILIVIRLMLEN